MSSAKTTTDHDAIRKWVEKRGGYPAVVKSTEEKGQPGGLLRIDYDEPGANEDTRPQGIRRSDNCNSSDLNQHGV
jgi:hypothetical protein